MTSCCVMPPEWAPQKRIWLGWPHQKADWPGKFAPIPWVFAEIARHVTAHQRLGLLVRNEAAKKEARDMLARAAVNLEQVDFLIMPTDRGWLRDCGPIWVRDQKSKALIGLDWGFSGWAKYSNHKRDNLVPPQLLAFTGHPGLQPQHKGRAVVLEGGGIEVDGAGRILVTEEWLLSKKQVRNKGFSRADYEEIFATYLGADRTIWLGKGIAGDDTHGHIDDITRFVAPGRVVTAIESDKRDANYALLKENLKWLKAARIEAIELPMPRPVIFDGERLPASYANFLICNKTVLVPVFNDKADARALDILQQCFPKREVVGVYARDLVWGLGTLHCLTQQEPA
jgi:agmatine deiminase